MDVALEELNEAVEARSRPTRSIYNVYGLVYAMLGENAKAEQNFQRALAARAAGFRDPPQLGLVPVHARPARRSRSPSSSRRSAIRCTRRPRSRWSTPAAAARRSATPRRAEDYFKRALARLAEQSRRRVRPRAARLSATGGSTRRAAGCAPSMLQANPAPEALYLGMCIERKLGDRSAEVSYASQLRNRYPDSAETQGASRPESASDRVRTSTRAPTAARLPAPRERRRAAARGARGARACRSTPSRSS